MLTVSVGQALVGLQMVHASCTNTGRLSNKRQASNTCQGSEPFVPTDTKELQYMLYLQLRFGHKGFSSTSDNQRWLEQLSCLSSTNTSKSSKNSPLLMLFKPFIILNNWIKSLRKGTVEGNSTDKGEESDVIVWKAHLPRPSAFYTLPEYRYHHYLVCQTRLPWNRQR